MFGIGEIVVLVSVGVIALSWRKIPKIGGTIRKSLLGFRDGLGGDEDETKNVRDVEPYDEKGPKPPPS